MFQTKLIQNKLKLKKTEEFQNYLQTVFMEQMLIQEWQELQK